MCVIHSDGPDYSEYTPVAGWYLTSYDHGTHYFGPYASEEIAREEMAEIEADEEHEAWLERRYER